MRLLKSHTFLNPINSYLIDSPQPSNLSYLWNFGSLLGLSLMIQIITGVVLAMHYNPSITEAFNSVEHIMRDVNNGWLIRYLHSNTASAFFFLVYLHIGRGLYYGSYRAPRTLVWTIGTFIFILMMAIAFLGYVLPYGQMSLWGATVITNLMSAIPWIGQDIVEYIWGGFSVNNATLNRFFALHFVLPFVLTALVIMHLVALHDSAGSSNPLGVSGNYDRLPFSPYFIFKDLITIFLFMLILSLFVFFMPNVLGDSENYVMADPMKTPAAIVPEWYLLPFYAILRSIPNKLLGVTAMFFAILILLLMPFLDISKLKGIQFKPFNKFVYFLFISNFIILMILGAKHVENPFIGFGQNCTVLYFAYFLIIIPIISVVENFSFKIADYNTGIIKNNKNSVLPNKSYLKYITVNNNFANKFMLFSVSVLSNGTIILTTINPNEVLSYFKSVIPKIKIPKSEINTYTDINNLTYYFNSFTEPKFKLAEYYKDNMYSAKDFISNFSNIDIYIYNLNNNYYNIIWSDVINAYYHNKPVFTCLLSFILYRTIFRFTNSNVNETNYTSSNTPYSDNLTNISVYTNRNNTTLIELQGQLSNVVNESNRLLSQLDSFINRFNSFVADNNVNIITDAQDNMSMDVPNNIDDEAASVLINRAHTLDNLIRNHINSLHELITRGNNLENNILNIDSSYNTQFEYINNRLVTLKNNYKHI